MKKIEEMTQKEQIEFFLEEYGSISTLEAYQEFGCMRLSARIDELIKEGKNIKMKMEQNKNRFGRPVHYARYWLDDGRQMKLPI